MGEAAVEISESLEDRRFYTDRSINVKAGPNVRCEMHLILPAGTVLELGRDREDDLVFCHVIHPKPDGTMMTMFYMKREDLAVLKPDRRACRPYTIERLEEIHDGANIRREDLSSKSLVLDGLQEKIVAATEHPLVVAKELITFIAGKAREVLGLV